MPIRLRCWPLVILALSLAYFAAAAGRRISLPGLYYDEVLFVNAATGGASDSFVDVRLFGVPVMLLDYIGALKAFLFAPVFARFGVSPATIRWPAILLSLGSIGVAYALARLTFNAAVAAALALVVALDPFFVYMTKLDYGPIVLMMFLKLVALYAFYRSIADRSPQLLWVVTAACILGTYDKLNFIWFVIALAATAPIFQRELGAMYRADRRAFIAPVATLATVMSVVAVGLIAPQLVESQQAPVRLIDRLPGLVERYVRSMDGREFYAWVTGAELPYHTIVNYLTALAAVALLVAWRGRRLQPLGHRFLAGYVVLFVVIAAQIAVTKRAGAPHHMMMLYPLHLLIVFGAIAVVACGRSRVPAAIATLLVLSLALTELKTTAHYRRAFESETAVRTGWSPVIYQLSSFLNSQHADRIAFVDWGIHNQIYALGDTPTRAACRDLWAVFRNGQPAREAEPIARDLRGGHVLAVLHDAAGEIFPEAQANFRAWSRANGFVLEQNRTFTDHGGRTTYRVYVVSESPQRASRSTNRTN